MLEKYTGALWAAIQYAHSANDDNDDGNSIQLARSSPATEQGNGRAARGIVWVKLCGATPETLM